MLRSLRQAASSWVSKVLLLLLVLSFAIWGISGEFAGYGSGTVAQVGDEEITTVEFDRALRNQLQAISGQTGDVFTLEQARSVGLPQQILGQLIAEAALDDQARQFNLGVSEDRLAREISGDPAFRGIAGSFDRARFQALLRSAGMREDDYVRDMRQGIARQQLVGAVAGGITAPQPLVEAIYRHQNEERAVSFVMVDQRAIEPVGEPDQAALEQFFNERRDQFRAPEYRRLAVLTLDRKSAADPAAIGEDEVAAEYERRLATDFTVPERRRVEQIRLETREAAEEAVRSLQAGGDFIAFAQGRGMAPGDIDLGLKAKDEIVDPAVADAAFAAAPNTVVPALDSPLGPAVIRVTAVEPGGVTPLEEAAPRIRDELAQRQAAYRLADLYDQIEDERAGGATLEEIAETLSLPHRLVDAVARDGTAPDGTPIADLPGGPGLLVAAFDSDVGVENDPIRLGDEAYVFYDVLETIPERERSLDEARAAVADAWRAEETANRINARAEALLARLKAGAPMAAIAAELGTTAQTVEGVKRGAPIGGLSENAVAQAFAGPEGHVANAEAEAPPARILLRVDRVTVPAFFAESESATGIVSGVSQAMQSDILRSFNAELLQEMDTRINNAAYALVTGEQAAN